MKVLKIVINKNEAFKVTWPFTAQFSYASGFKQHFVDVGLSDGEFRLCQNQKNK